jgi:hypothetical protein
MGTAKKEAHDGSIAGRVPITRRRSSAFEANQKTFAQSELYRF